MKDLEVQKQLNGTACKFTARKKMKPREALDEIVTAMDLVGGITGLKVASHQTMTILNHTASYNFPIRYEEHSPNLSSFGKKTYRLLEHLQDYLISHGVSPRNIEYHMGKMYSSKHHDPRR